MAWGSAFSYYSANLTIILSSPSIVFKCSVITREVFELPKPKSTHSFIDQSSLFLFGLINYLRSTFQLVGSFMSDSWFFNQISRISSCQYGKTWRSSFVPLSETLLNLALRLLLINYPLASLRLIVIAELPVAGSVARWLYF